MNRGASFVRRELCTLRAAPHSSSRCRRTASLSGLRGDPAELKLWKRFEVRIKESIMNNIIWIVGAVVIVLVILGFLGFR
jgi:hypothetical protein